MKIKKQNILANFWKKICNSTLIWAANYGFSSLAQLMILSGADINAATNKGWTALMRASLNGHRHVVAILIDKGAKLNSANGWTALMYASINQHAEVVETLIFGGVDTNATDTNGMTALLLLAAHGYLQEREKPGLQIVELLSKTSANAIDKEGKTALMYAAERGDLSMVRELMENGADKNIVDNKGKTALAYAQAMQHQKITGLLETATSVAAHKSLVPEASPQNTGHQKTPHITNTNVEQPGKSL